LSDDVYRYIWDGHLLNNGVNPYSFPVNSPQLDGLNTPLRALVNHDWMASPYLPAAQLVFAAVESLFPQNVLGFQVVAVLFDLFTGWLILNLLQQFGLPDQNLLIYLWNPLVIVEFAHGAHIDALMLFLMMLAIWFLVKASGQSKSNSPGSALALAAAGLTKIIPLFLVPIFWWRWSWKDRLIFGAVLIGFIAIFSIDPGLGLIGPLDGTGVFGAIRIYAQLWNYNSGIYHWLEVLISGYATPGAVPVDVVGVAPLLIARLLVSAMFGFALLYTGWLAWKISGADQPSQAHQNLDLIRLGLIPLGAYLLFTTTLHPWYAAVVIPLLPFLSSRDDEDRSYEPFSIPWIYFSIMVALSYLTYLDPADLREYTWVRLLEYIPLYGLLAWAGGRLYGKIRKSSQTASE
jgi:hypothetical protein